VEESLASWIICEPETAKMCLSVVSKVNWDVEVIVIGEADGCIPVDALLEDDGSGNQTQTSEIVGERPKSLT